MTTPATAADLPGRCPGSTAHERPTGVFSLSAQAFAAATSSGDEPVGSRRESLIRQLRETLPQYWVNRKTPAHSLSTMSASGAASSTRCTPFHMQSGINGRQTDVAPQPVLCRDVRFQFFHGSSADGFAFWTRGKIQRGVYLVFNNGGRLHGHTVSHRPDVLAIKGVTHHSQQVFGCHTVIFT